MIKKGGSRQYARVTSGCVCPESMKKTAAFLLSLALLLSLLPEAVFAAPAGQRREEADIESIAQGIINWKKQDNGAAPEGNLLNDTYLELAGTTPGDWYPIGLGRLGVPDAYDAYLAVIKDIVQTRYKQPGKLSSVKSTEWHRISLAILAMGGDPTNMGLDEAGQPINLIADGSYNRGAATSLGRQGINGWIWGLICVDSMRYDIPAGSFYTRDDIIVEILRQQLADGGFTLTGETADPDITAMALQALAPYYNSEKRYTYQQKMLGSSVTKTVRQVVDESLHCLSALQLDSGDFKSWGTQNVESTCQVVVALCALGIDPQQDPRFIKNGVTLIDGILAYQLPDGGFVHSYTYDPENPTSLPDQSNTMASEQTLYTMAAVLRQMRGQRTLYDFRPEQSTALRQRIEDLTLHIEGASGKTAAAGLTELLGSFYSLPETERSYVYNYWKLSDLAKAAGIDVAAIAKETPVVHSPEDTAEEPPLLYFSDSDKAAVDALPTPLTTEQYVLVVKLLEKLEQSEDFTEKQAYLERLTQAKADILAVQAEVDAINAAILEQLYPFSHMSLGDKPVIDSIVRRYGALSPYDQAKIQRWEDVIKTKTKVDNLLRALVISVVCVVLCAVLTVVMVKRVKQRKRAKALDMEALAAQYAHEDTE